MPFRITSILVASDLSEGARPILRAAAALAALTEAELHVVHAAESPANREAEGRPGGQGHLRALHAALQEQLGVALPAGAVVGSHQADTGRAHEVILARATEVRADLIVIGPHRERAGSERVLGTTADRLMRTSDGPCLIVHAPLSLPLRRVLVPSDLSDAAQGALDVALIWGVALRMPTVSGEQTSLHVLHVLPRAPEEISSPQERARARDELHAQVAAADARMGSVSVLDIREEVVHGGAPADEILNAARAHRVDLLVMGTHGHGMLSRALVGSVSSTVARRARCPVLLVPPALWKAQKADEAARGI